jgi:hypothetical protein
MKRDNKYLENLLYEIWEEYFPDVPRKNFVIIKFGKYSKRQLGSIKKANEKTKIKRLMQKYKDLLEIQDEKSISVITITRYFQSEDIPEYILISTIAHELCHYTHGFNSPLPKLFEYPHQGGIVSKEMDKRGLREMRLKTRRWLKEKWSEII